MGHANGGHAEQAENSIADVYRMIDSGQDDATATIATAITALAHAVLAIRTTADTPHTARASSEDDTLSIWRDTSGDLWVDHHGIRYVVSSISMAAADAEEMYGPMTQVADIRSAR